MNRTTVITVVLFAFLVSVATSTLAASSQGPGAHTKIMAVFVANRNGELEILGQDLDFGPGPLAVTLGGVSLIVTSAESTKIVAQLPDEFVVGDYLLEVSNGNGQSQSDEYDLTIGLDAKECPCWSLFVEITKDSLPDELASCQTFDDTDPPDLLPTDFILLGSGDFPDAGFFILLENNPVEDETYCAGASEASGSGFNLPVETDVQFPACEALLREMAASRSLACIQ